MPSVSERPEIQTMHINHPFHCASLSRHGRNRKRHRRYTIVLYTYTVPCATSVTSPGGDLWGSMVRSPWKRREPSFCRLGSVTRQSRFARAMTLASFPLSFFAELSARLRRMRALASLRMAAAFFSAWEISSQRYDSVSMRQCAY